MTIEERASQSGKVRERECRRVDGVTDSKQVGAGGDNFTTIKTTCLTKNAKRKD